MSNQHNVSCGRRLARESQAAGLPVQDSAFIIQQHCGISLLRADRIARGYTLSEATELLKEILDANEIPSQGLAHQSISRWERGAGMPSRRYFDALCQLYQTRPDRLGLGHDFSADHEEPETAGSAYLPMVGDMQKPVSVPSEISHERQRAENVRRRDFAWLIGTGAVAASTKMPLGDTREQSESGTRAATRATTDQWEARSEQAGNLLYTASPADFIPARMADYAGVQRLLLHGQPMDIQRRLHRVLAKNAAFIAFRLNDISAAEDTFDWHRIALRAAKRADDQGLEAWIVGHWARSYACYGRMLRYGLDSARLAQQLSGGRSNSATAFAYIAEAGIQARLGRARETVEAVRHAEQIFKSLPGETTAHDGTRTPEFLFRWHQANSLALAGEEGRAETYRVRAFELPMARQDIVGSALLLLDRASFMLRSGSLDEGCHAIVRLWDSLPTEFRTGQIPRRTTQIVDSLRPAHAATHEVHSLREYLRSMIPGTQEEQPA